MNVEKWIKIMREQKGLSQGKISEKLGFANPQFISNMERGKCELPLKHYKKVSRILGTSVKVLIALKIQDEKEKVLSFFK